MQLKSRLQQQFDQCVADLYRQLTAAIGSTDADGAKPARKRARSEAQLQHGAGDTYATELTSLAHFGGDARPTLMDDSYSETVAAVISGEQLLGEEQLRALLLARSPPQQDFLTWYLHHLYPMPATGAAVAGNEDEGEGLGAGWVKPTPGTALPSSVEHGEAILKLKLFAIESALRLCSGVAAQCTSLHAALSVFHPVVHRLEGAAAALAQGGGSDDTESKRAQQEELFRLSDEVLACMELAAAAASQRKHLGGWWLQQPGATDDSRQLARDVCGAIIVLRTGLRLAADVGSSSTKAVQEAAVACAAYDMRRTGPTAVHGLLSALAQTAPGELKYGGKTLYLVLHAALAKQGEF